MVDAKEMKWDILYYLGYIPHIEKGRFRELFSRFTSLYNDHYTREELIYKASRSVVCVVADSFSSGKVSEDILQIAAQGCPLIVPEKHAHLFGKQAKDILLKVRPEEEDKNNLFHNFEEVKTAIVKAYNVDREKVKALASKMVSRTVVSKEEEKWFADWDCGMDTSYRAPNLKEI